MYQTDSDGAQPTLSKLRVLDISAPWVHSTQICAESLKFLFPSIVDISAPASHQVYSERKFAWDVVVSKVLGQRPVTSPDTSNAVAKECLFCEDDDDYGSDSDWEDEGTEGDDSEW